MLIFVFLKVRGLHVCKFLLFSVLFLQISAVLSPQAPEGKLGLGFNL